MNSPLLVLAGSSDTATHLAQVAAALGGQRPLVLLHVDAAPLLLEPELVVVAAEQTARYEAETMGALHRIAQSLPVAATVAESGGTMTDAVADAVARYQPLLLVMGLSSGQTLLDALLHSQVLPVLRAIRRPLLLVPPAAVVERPKRVLLAADGEAFTPTPETLALAPLLLAWEAAYTVTHVTAHHHKADSRQLTAQQYLPDGLLPPNTLPEFYGMSQLAAGNGVVQAITDTHADLVVLLARPRGFLNRRFHRSVTAQVLHYSPVPVLLLPGKASDMPGWMPRMS